MSGRVYSRRKLFQKLKAFLGDEFISACLTRWMLYGEFLERKIVKILGKGIKNSG